MRTPTDRLQFAIRFAQMDLGRLRVGDWINLKEDMQNFLSRAGPLQPFDVKVFLALPSTPAADLSKEDCQAIQHKMLDMLEKLVDKRGGHKVAPTVKGDGLTFNLLPGPVPVVQGPASSELFGFVLFYLIAQEAKGRVLRCPECQTIFYRHRKQKYCSRTCTNRANVKNWRGRHAETPRQP